MYVLPARLHCIHNATELLGFFNAITAYVLLSTSSFDNSLQAWASSLTARYGQEMQQVDA